ncbi:Gfo/Idh/MocA family oxidoreductase [Symmachiella dynata]|uniref:Gfo/Idh/MocA family protein n=1 Tax=Symmachiella dynata TaxID=2527995 RepID=UPI0030ECF418
MSQVGVALIGSQFISTIHYESLQRVAAAEVRAVASRTEEHVRQFAEERGIPHWTTDYRELLKRDDIDMVVLGVPNYLHCEITVAAAQAGKHVVVEKPMAMNVAECDEMIAACHIAGVKLMYAEELCFTPKYVRLKQLADEGALGDLFLIKQSEKHDGPHAPWFWDVEKSGGGVMLDMGCHGIELARWMLGRPPITSVYCDLKLNMHADKTRGDDTSILIVDFEGGATAYIEESWAKLGGMDDRAEVHGTGGVAYADILQGTSIQTYSKEGYGYAVEKAGDTKGWSYTIYEEAWNYGFPQEMEHFVHCVRDDQQPCITGHDGRAVMEALYAAYASAGQGRRIDLPFETDAKTPFELWGGVK